MSTDNSRLIGGSVDLILCDKQGRIVESRIDNHNIIFDAGRANLIFGNMLWNNTSTGPPLYNSYYSTIFLSTYNTADGYFDYWDSSKLVSTIKNEINAGIPVITTYDVNTKIMDFTAGPITTTAAYTIREVGMRYNISSPIIVSAVELSSPVYFPTLYDLYVYYRFVIGLDPTTKYYNVEMTTKWDTYSSSRTWYRTNHKSANRKWWDVGYAIGGVAPMSQTRYLAQEVTSIGWTRNAEMPFSGYYKDGNSMIAVAACKNPTVSRIFAHQNGSNNMFYSTDSPQSVGKIIVTFEPDQYLPLGIKLHYPTGGDLSTAQYYMTIYPGMINGVFPYAGATAAYYWPGIWLASNSNRNTYWMYTYVSTNGRYIIFNSATASADSNPDTLSTNTYIYDMEGVKLSTPDIGYSNCRSIAVDNNGVIWFIKNSEPSTLYRQDTNPQYCYDDLVTNYRTSFNFAGDFPSETIQLRLIQVDETDQTINVLSNRGIFKVYYNSCGNQPYSIPAGWRGTLYHNESTTTTDWTYTLFDESTGGFEGLERSDFDPYVYTPRSNNTSTRPQWTFQVKNKRFVWLIKNRLKVIYADINGTDGAVEKVYTTIRDGVALHETDPMIAISGSGASILEIYRPLLAWSLVFSVATKDDHAYSFSGCYLYYQNITLMTSSPYGYYNTYTSNRYNFSTSTIESIPWSYLTNYRSNDTMSVNICPNRSIFAGAMMTNSGAYLEYSSFVGSILQMICGPISYGWDSGTSSWKMGTVTPRGVQAFENFPYGITVQSTDSSSNWVTGEQYHFGVHPAGYWIDSQQEVSFQDFIYAGYYKVLSERHTIPTVAPYTVAVNKVEHPSWIRMNHDSREKMLRVMYDATGRSEAGYMHATETGFMGIEGFYKTSSVTNGKYEYYCDINGVFYFNERDAGRDIEIRYTWVARLP